MYSEEYSAAEIQKFKMREQKEADLSYRGYSEKTWPRKVCPNCGVLLKRNSISYHEGYHFDGCF